MTGSQERTVNERKRQRIAESDHQRAIKRAREISSLAVAALRAASALAVLQDTLIPAEAGTERFADEHQRALDQLEVNSASRASAQMTLFYAALYVVVEGWLEADQTSPMFADPEVDRLLARVDLVRALADYRNSMLHPTQLNEQRQLRFAAVHRELVGWAQELCAAFLRFFRTWRRNRAGDKREP
jgi:hypothetical protein